jgi:phage-related baseplate assembly protein
MIEGRLSDDQLRELAALDNPEKLDYEAILGECANTLQAVLQRDQSTTELNIGALPESDPLRKLIEVTAYRELLARQQINESIQACRLASAQGQDLKRLAALMLPPLDEPIVNEEAIRSEILNQYQVKHTAGSVEAYKHFARIAVASGLIVDINVESPSTGVVDICLLFHSKLHLDNNSLRPDFVGPRRNNQDYENERAGYLSQVKKNLYRDDVRPIGHYVRVRQAKTKNYTVKARLGVVNQPGAEEVLATARREVWRYITERYRLGATVYRSGILSALHQASVQYILLDDLVPGASQADVGLNGDQAPLCSLIQIEIDSEVPDEIVRNANIEAVTLREGNLSCDLMFEPPSNETRITHYLVYWGTSQNSKLSGVPPVASLSVGGEKRIRLVAITIPENAQSLIIFTANQNGEMDTGFTITIPFVTTTGDEQ